MTAPLRVLVAGGAGYIGSVIAAQLLQAGHQVTVADSLARGHRDAIPAAASFEQVDLLDTAAVHALICRGFDAVVHLAALSLVAESVEQPARYFRANVVGSLNVLDAMRAAGVRRLIFSSTAAVYGLQARPPIREDEPARPGNAYGASKLAVDQAIGFECDATGLGAVSLRYFNVAGASGPAGERHDPETHLIPLVLRAANGAQPHVTVFGTDYPTPDGTAIRDYIHVEDLATAHLLALDATSTPGHRIYNLGNGTGFSVREVIDAARRVTGVDIMARDAPRRSGDPAVLVASSERIRSDLGWKPAKPELATMVADAWNFLRARTDDHAAVP